MQKTLTIWNYFTIGFGAIIGTGWVLQVGDWMVKGGGPVAAIIAFIIGGLFFLPIGAVFGELTAAIPISGGIIEYVDRSFGSTVSYLTGWLLALGTGIICPWETIAISTLVSEMFGQLFPVLRSVKLYNIFGADVYLWPTLIALAFAGYVIFLNFKGASATAKLQAFLTKALLCGMVLAMIIALFVGSPSNALPLFQQVTDAPAGSGNFTSAGGFFAGILSVLVIRSVGIYPAPQLCRYKSRNGCNDPVRIPDHHRCEDYSKNRCRYDHRIQVFLHHPERYSEAGYYEGEFSDRRQRDTAAYSSLDILSG